MGKTQWMATIPYVLMLIVVVNVHFLGIYEFYVYGIYLPLLSMIPFVAFVVWQFRSDSPFVRSHVHTALTIFIQYFILVAFLGVVMHILGYQVNIINTETISSANRSSWIAAAPLLVILLWTFISIYQGVRCALAMRYPHSSTRDE